MQQGMAEKKVTPKKMLEIGLQFDMEAVDPELRKALEAEFKTDLSLMWSESFIKIIFNKQS
ncbi:MAG: hypothetical protein ABIO81_14115 [Ginsengibacter sp.]